MPLVLQLAVRPLAIFSNQHSDNRVSTKNEYVCKASPWACLGLALGWAWVWLGLAWACFGIGWAGLECALAWLLTWLGLVLGWVWVGFEIAWAGIGLALGWAWAWLDLVWARFGLLCVCLELAWAAMGPLIQNAGRSTQALFGRPRNFKIPKLRLEKCGNYIYVLWKIFYIDRARC
jgi:hypothetical protein